MKNYDHKKIEAKWQKYWSEHPELTSSGKRGENKKYILDMFPYPSGEGLHVGHVESYTATDIYSRYCRLKGLDVLHPQGFDAFGLPAENFAIKTGIHPSETTKKAIANFKSQMDRMGFSYDWSREVVSSDPGYYKWTQWFFLLLYENGYAYKKKAKANWCESCQTVLANEQTEGGICERCGNEVIQKELEQWFFKISDFIENNGETAGLISGLEKVDWPESTKAVQRNWIGKSEGVEFDMKVEGEDEKLTCYTTRIDTVYGITYAVLDPEHELINKLKKKIKNWNEVEQYLIAAQNKTELERAEQKEKTGVPLEGLSVINPFNDEIVPLWVGDYVLGHYGTGAVMAVPAHDERDFEFAKKFNLQIKQVVRGEEEFTNNAAFTQDGVLIESGKFSGLSSEQAREKMAKWLEENNIGTKKINYRLRDWLVSRQRYWGTPIPIIYCEKCGTIPVPEKDLPVMLPTDVDFKPTGESPLTFSKKFHDVSCPKCGNSARRESDTMDTFVCSSWYYFRYSDPKNEKQFASKEAINKWLPVDLYVGGAEHTVLHLLYARFFTKVLHKLEYIDFDEPFLKLRHQGIILAEDGTKMSKSKGNVVNPDEVVDQVGADALRMFEMFMGPLEDMKPWNTQGIIGIVRFLEKIWRISEKMNLEITNSQVASELEKAIKKVTEDIEALHFNTAISQMMIFVNVLNAKPEITRKDWERFLIVLSPFAPYIAEELWQKAGNEKSIFAAQWPQYNEDLIQSEEIELVVQVNGKLRDRLQVSPEILEEEAKNLALKQEKVKTFIADKQIRKVIFVRGKLINIVVN